MYKRLGVAAILLLAFAGLSNATYLAQNALYGTPLICDIQNLTGCEEVAASDYSDLFGIPIAVYGVVFYGLVFIIAALELLLFDRFLRRALQVASIVGMLMSIYFTIVQKFFIGAFCIYCLTSAVIALAIFFIATSLEPIRRRSRSQTEHTPFSMPPKA